MIVPTPPPINGMTIVTDQMIEVVGDRAEVHAIQNRRPKSRIPWGMRRHLQFIFETCKASLSSKGRDIAYFVPSADRGLLFNLLLAPLLRIAFRRVWLHHHVSRYIKQHDWRMSLFLGILGSKAHHITLSSEMSFNLKELYGASLIVPISNAGFLRDLPPREKNGGQIQTIGFIGNVSEEKGILRFIEVIETLNNLNIDIKALIAGPCDDPKVSQHVKAFIERSPNSRQYLGLVSGDAKAKFFRDTDVILFPSSYSNEAQPMVIFEALAYGIPVLATTAGYITEQLRDTSWSIPQSSYVADVANQIKRWVEDVDDYRESQKKAREIFAMEKALSRTRLKDWLAAT